MKKVKQKTIIVVQVSAACPASCMSKFDISCSFPAGFRLEYATGIGVEGTYANFRVSCQNIQADDQSPFTRCA